MAFDYSKIAKTANRLIGNFGQSLAIAHVVAGEYVPGTGITNTITYQYGSGTIADWNINQIDGTLINVGDKRLLLSPLDTDGLTLTAPSLGDTVIVDDILYTLIAPLKTISPADTPVLFDCNMSGIGELVARTTEAEDIRITESGYIRTTE